MQRQKVENTALFEGLRTDHSTQQGGLACAIATNKRSRSATGKSGGYILQQQVLGGVAEGYVLEANHIL